jgi:hypothetical protein
MVQHKKEDIQTLIHLVVVVDMVVKDIMMDMITRKIKALIV